MGTFQSRSDTRQSDDTKVKGPVTRALIAIFSALLLEKRQNGLLRSVGLSQHRGGCLLQDLLLGQVGRFRSEVGILNTAQACLDRLGVGRQVRHGVIKPVTDSAIGCTVCCDRGDCSVDRVNEAGESRRG